MAAWPGLALACGHADARARPVASCDPQASDLPGYCSYPADIRAFVDDRDACDHWRGEPWPEDSEVDDPTQREWALHRRKEITDAINATCTGTDKRLSGLKGKYVNDPRVMQLLDEYETDIEAGD